MHNTILLNLHFTDEISEKTKKNLSYVNVNTIVTYSHSKLKKTERKLISSFSVSWLPFVRSNFLVYILNFN